MTSKPDPDAPKRHRKGCMICGAACTVGCVDNFGHPYKGCPNCRVKSLEEIGRMTDAPKPGPRRNCISDESAAPKPGPPEADGSPAMLRAMAPDLKPFHRAVVMAAASAYDKLAEERTSLRKAVDRLETDNAQLRAALGTAVATTEEWHVEYTRECADSESLRAQLAAVTKELDDCRAVLEGT